MQDRLLHGGGCVKENGNSDALFGAAVNRVGMDSAEQAAVTENEISVLVDAFYARVQQDAVIGPIFNEQIEDWPAHLVLLKDFWATVVLAAGRGDGRIYKGNPLETHLKLKLEPRHFERWLALFRETALEVLPREKAAVFIEKSQRIAETFQRVIAAKKTGLGSVNMRG